MSAGEDTTLHTLRDVFGLESFRPGQAEVIRALLAGRSAAAVFPTGAGKSLCYQLPALLLPGITLVVSPLIALMKDQIDALEARGIAAIRLDSTLGNDAFREAVARIRSGEVRILYVAPERFTNERFREMLQGLEISLFAVDEAHCISEWGHNFRPDYLKLARFAEQFRARVVLALTATATPSVLEDIRSGFAIAPEDAVRTAFHRPNLVLNARVIDGAARDAALAEMLGAQPAPTIVYTTLQRTAEAVAEKLVAQGLPARAYHAGMEDTLRADVQEWFMRSGDSIVVATIAFGMGIDKSNIRSVVHYNVPKSLENYAQEIGRAGRDGAPSQCQLLYCPGDLNALEGFIYGDWPEPTSIRSLVEEVLSSLQGAPEVRIALTGLATRHDIRTLVARTLLTYLEMDGHLEELTPVYGKYQFAAKRDEEEIFAAFDGERRDFLRGLFGAAKKARKWATLDLDDAARKLGCDRGRIVRALDFLAERDLLEVRASGLMHRFRRTGKTSELEPIVRELCARMDAREARELGRLQQVVALATEPGCIADRLSTHFGERLPAPCGTCSGCRSKSVPDLPPTRQLEIPEHIIQAALALQSENARTLGTSRRLTKLLCGIASPWTTGAKLHRHMLFGALPDAAFRDVLERVERG
jgi:ATP-dependent DNA helicase RecQ